MSEHFHIMLEQGFSQLEPFSIALLHAWVSYFPAIFCGSRAIRYLEGSVNLHAVKNNLGVFDTFSLSRPDLFVKE